MMIVLFTVELRWSQLWGKLEVLTHVLNNHVEHALSTLRTDHYADAAPLEYG